MLQFRYFQRNESFFFQRYHLPILIIIFNDTNQYKNCLPMKLFKKKRKENFQEQ